MNRVDAQSAAACEAEGVTDLVMHVLSSDVGKQRAAMEDFARRMLS